MMQNHLIEAALVSALFIGYLVLWKFREKRLLYKLDLNPEVIRNDTRPTQRFFFQLSRLLTVSVILLITLHGLNLSSLVGFCRVRLIDKSIFDYIGFSIGSMGLLLCLLAQIEMGTNWRVGIDRESKNDLVTTGVFKFVRNPTYTGLFILSIGVWLIFPTMAFMVWGIVFYISIEFQVRIEEEFLTKYHGERYTRYIHDTRRYIPFIY